MSNEDKRKKRTENRKRKIEAFLAVAELNDEETKKFKLQGIFYMYVTQKKEKNKIIQHKTFFGHFSKYFYLKLTIL